MGNINARSLGKIQKLAQTGDFDMVLHVGKHNWQQNCFKIQNGSILPVFPRRRCCRINLVMLFNTR